MEKFSTQMNEQSKSIFETKLSTFEKLEQKIQSNKSPFELLENRLSINNIKTERPGDSSENQNIEMQNEESGEFASSYKERLDITPKDGDRGNYEGTRGESNYVPTDSEIKQICADHGVMGVSYENAIPDFSPFSKETVEIENMTDNRDKSGGNYEQSDIECAKKWSEETKDGRTDWSAREVKQWRTENGYSWHECNDRKTCQLIPTKINAYFGHLGGVSECAKLLNKGEEFDE